MPRLVAGHHGKRDQHSKTGSGHLVDLLVTCHEVVWKHIGTRGDPFVFAYNLDLEDAEVVSTKPISDLNTLKITPLIEES
jgi:hypothetical protein